MFNRETVRGMRDILPAEAEIRAQLLSTLTRLYTSYGYMQIETPAMERIENLSGRLGGDNEKLIFRVLKRGEKLSASLGDADPSTLCDAGMRYDLTVPLARYYAANAASLPFPFRSLQIGPVWRADRPQKGRFRQFTQCDIDILGDPTEAAESELILVTSRFLESAGVSGNTVLLNDRRLLKGMARKAGFPEERDETAFVVLDKYEKAGEDGVRRELLEEGFPPAAVANYLSILHGFSGAEDRLAYAGETFGDLMEPDVTDRLRRVIEAVSLMSDGRFRLSLDPTLVRGMGYYTGAIFEVKSEDFRGSSIAGGGRYDRMIGRFTGQPVPACGFSIGFERIVGALLDKQRRPEGQREKIAVLYGRGFTAADVAALQRKYEAARQEGKIVLVERMVRNVGFQKQRLEAEGYRTFIDARDPRDV